jgi:ArsR family transcriptional regulator, arsenate/arsenite/antimonite-responsive transcriptional repressor
MVWVDRYLTLSVERARRRGHTPALTLRWNVLCSRSRVRGYYRTMPFEVIDQVDPLTNLIQFKTSAVYELLISLQTLVNPPRHHAEWAERSRDSLPKAVIAEIRAMYEEFSDGNMYLELPVDYPDHDDVMGFFNYVRGLSDADFVFYLVGRILPRDEISHRLPSRDAVREALSVSTELYERYGQYLEAILADICAFKMRLVALWQTYWEAYFNREVIRFAPAWMAGIQDRHAQLQREGGRLLLEKLTGRVEMPPELPPGMPVSSITVTPVYLLPSRVFRFYGYGNITVLFDPQYTEARKIAVEQGKDDALATIRALDDDTRLTILRLIAQKRGLMHGKAIAEHLGISASAVSRHLSLLKEGGLITEQPNKNVTTYQLQKHALTDLVNKLLDYLGS